jgi:hypothetical protein
VVEVVVTATPDATPEAAAASATPSGGGWNSPVRPDYVPTHPVWSNKGAILYRSEHPEQPGYWVVDPDGSNRRFVAPARELDEEFGWMRQQETYSPVSDCWVVGFPGYQGSVAVACVATVPGDNPFREMLSCSISEGLSGASYDPVWSPDGQRIAFVSQHARSDDIWVSRPCTFGAGVDLKLANLTPNDWEWDKHPSWSPDSRRIVFWSNRTGERQLFILDVASKEVTPLSESTWSEYDPLWIK